MPVFNMAFSSTSGGNTVNENRKKREVPYQDFARIKNCVLRKGTKNGQISDEALYTDPSFPPDQSSLTYVYSGDDKYEKMIFKRPKQIYPDAVLIGIGSACVAEFPYTQWRQKAWFKAALVIVSLSVKNLERLIPGYRSMEQSFNNDYVGAFRFNLWRFGEWIEAVVDDFLPMLGDQVAFCSPLGFPPEFWPPLIEKAYAKCCKTYEAIEVGKTLDALTDLTGAICEYFTPDVNPPENLFHILYKSSVNRSFMVCWRNDKRLTPTGFDLDLINPQADGSEKTHTKSEKYLHIISATTKFPMTDGRLIEMVRLKCLFSEEPKWHGKFSNKDGMSWKSLNMEFATKYKPFTHKDDDEFWICLEDFRCNFGGLVICNSEEPFRCQGFNIERKYSASKPINFRKASNSLPTSSRSSKSSQDSPVQSFVDMTSTLEKYRFKSKQDDSRARIQSFDVCVKETKKTIKVDNSGFTTDESSSGGSIHSSTTVKYYKKISTRNNMIRHKSRRKFSHQNPVIKSKDIFSSTADRTLSEDSDQAAQCEDTSSTSDIYITVQASQSSEHVPTRPRSAPAPTSIPRAQSTGSLNSLVESTFLATRADHFRSHGSWHEMINYKGSWTNQVSSQRLVADAKKYGSRVLLAITKPDGVNENIAPDLEGRAHVVVSLMQDYRRCSTITRVLMAHIGFLVYKTKNPDKDEKRNLSKLVMVSRHDSKGDSREIIARLDLVPGNYFIVPYCSDLDHEGEYLVRVLGEKDSVASKQGCLVS